MTNPSIAMKRLAFCTFIACLAVSSRANGQGGIITTVAGNGNKGFSGDGGPATGASLDDPEHVAVDGSGNLFISDVLNNRIRKVSPNGIITTVVGNGNSGFSGDCGPATACFVDHTRGCRGRCQRESFYR